MPRILLIDDTEALHRPISRALTLDGIEVHSALNGTTGIQLARELLPDLILLDVLMPDLNGYDVCQKLSEHPETARIPVIFLSGIQDMPGRIRGLDLGAADFIAKPFNVEELRARVRVHLRNKASLDKEFWRAMHDGLTGVWSRRYFDERFLAEIAMSQRNLTPLSLILMDVDRFKSINDAYGHIVGDEILRHVGHMLDENRRKNEAVCRYGGEEFAILCPMVNAQQATALAERLRTKIAEQHFFTRAGGMKITCSFGVAGGIGSEHLLIIADRALYDAKDRGRNVVVEHQATPNNANTG